MEFRNLLPANVADGTDSLGTTTGFVGSGSTRTSDTTEFYIGSRSIKVVTNGAASNENVSTDYNPIIPNQTYIGSAYVKGSGTVRLKLVERTSAGAFISSVTSSEITLTSNFQRLNVNKAFGSTGVRYQLLVETVGTQSITFYADAWQLELGSTATTWMPGNLLSFNQQSVETDLTGLTKGQSNCTTTISRVTSDYFTGSASAQVNLDTITTTPYYFVTGVNSSGGTYLSPAQPGKTYLFMVSTKYKKNGHSNLIRLWPRLIFMNSSYGWIGTNEPPAITITDNQWQKTYIIAVAPANTVYAYVNVRTQANDGVVGDKLYWDDAWLIDYSPFILGGIGSQESVSNASLKSNVLPSSVPSGQSINNVVLRSSLNPNGIGSVANIQNLGLQSKLNPSSVSSSEFVNDLLLRSNINPNSIPSLETVSDLVLNNILLPLGIISEETINNLTLNNTLELLGIISTETLGNPHLLPNIILEAITTQETINDAILYIYYEFMELLINVRSPSSDMQITNPSTEIITRNPSSQIEVKKW